MSSKEKYAEYIFTLNRIESELNMVINSFFTPKFNSESGFRGVVLSRALNDPYIFTGFQSKINLINRINKSLAERASPTKYSYDVNFWKGLAKEIEEVQKLRNELAHQWILFSNTDDTVQFDKITKASKLEKKIVDLNIELAKLKKLHIDVQRFSVQIVNEPAKISSYYNDQNDLM